MSSDWSIPGVDLNYTFGPLFLAHCFNWCLYGLLWLQVYTYYYSFPRDAPKFKALVYIVALLDSASIAVATYSGWVVFVKNWGNVWVLNHLGWSWSSVPASAGFVAFIVQSFFAYRIWIISRSWYMPAFIVLLSGVACGFAFGAAHEVYILQTFKYIRHLIPSIWLSFGIAADFFVCATLVFYLIRKPSPFGQTNRVIVRIVRIAIETALVTIVAASFKLFLIFSRRDNMHLIFCLLLPRLYTNAMLGTLNSRSPVFGGGQSFQGSLGPAGGSMPFSSFRRHSGPSEKFHGVGDVESGYDSIPGETHFVGLDSPNSPTYPLTPMSPTMPMVSVSVYKSPPPSPISPPPSAKTTSRV